MTEPGTGSRRTRWQYPVTAALAGIVLSACVLPAPLAGYITPPPGLFSVAGTAAAGTGNGAVPELRVTQSPVTESGVPESPAAKSGATDSGSGEAPGVKAPGPGFPPVRETVSGDYLKALHAYNNSDLAMAARNFSAVLEADPGHPGLTRRAFLARISDGRMAEAVDMAAALVERRSDYTFARLVLALDALQKGDHAAARLHLGAMEESRLTRILRPLLLAWTETGSGDRKAAESRLAEIRQQVGFALLANLHSGYIAALNDDPEVLDTSFRAALAALEHPPARLRIGAALHYARSGRSDIARELLSGDSLSEQNRAALDAALAAAAAGQKAKGLVSSVTDGAAEALFDIASALQQDRGSGVALIYARLALHMRPDFPLARLLVGEILDDRGRHAEALEIYRQIDRDSTYHLMAGLRRSAALDAGGQQAEALAVLRTLSQLYPENATILIRLADMLRAEEKWPEAVATYDRAFGKLGGSAGEDWTLHYTRGIALERSRQWERAESDFLKALELSPEQPYVMNYLAYSWVEQGRNLADARALIERAAEQRPEDGYIVDSLGWVLYRLGEYDEAVPHLERAVRLQPNDAVINDHLGDAYWKAGREREAVYQWRRSLEMGPEPGLAADIARKLRDRPLPGTDAHAASQQ